MGHAVFQVRDHALELRRHSAAEAAVDNAWVNRVSLVAEGLDREPYIHLDIRTPFGETVTDEQVERALAEGLGPRNDRYRMEGWHIQFVEDTNLGSNHRVFVDLRNGEARAGTLDGVDFRLPLELAVEALGDLILADKGEANFQFILGGGESCYSLLYLNGAPFHVLRVGEGPGPWSIQRLIRHREFAFGQGKNAAPSRTFLCRGDGAAAMEGLAGLRPEILDFGLDLPAGETGSSRVTLPGPLLCLHLGLAHAARKRDFARHNRVDDDERSRSAEVRTRHRFWLASGSTAGVCLAVALIYLGVLKGVQSQLDALRAQAAGYQAQVASIKALRREKSRLETSLEELRPLWAGPVRWKSVFADLGAALPKESGIDGLSVNRKNEGSLDLTFRAWVKDWDQVQAIQRRLAASRHFSSVVLSEQRKDMSSGVVIFNVTCQMERK